MLKPRLYNLLFVLLPAVVFAANLHPSLAGLSTSESDSVVSVWVYFKDKDNSTALNKTRLEISDEALQRRSYQNPAQLMDDHDRPLASSYKVAVSGIAKRIRTESRWLNAVSVEVPAQRLAELTKLNFVRSIEPVVRYYKQRPSEEEASVLGKSSLIYSLDYGASQLQLEQMGVPALHEKGLSGSGVIVAMLDDGFNRYKTHRVFESLNVDKTWDFINNDEAVDDPQANPVEGWHGTLTLSVLAGYDPGQLVGAAYNATLLLAKTEMDYQEIQAEEDFWVAGLEWAERNGARIVNSSLGYSDWYSWEDMDGQTAVTTKATIIAEQKGVIVVNSAGNNGNSAAPNTLNAPADGEFVITAGGVRDDGSYWTTSSYGPTADGRAKPTVAALGRSAYSASSTSDTGYRFASGTSFSSPLVAGAIALLLEANPELTPAQVREAITATASRAQKPDNFVGYGILDIEGAYDYLNLEIPGKIPEEIILRQNTPNPFNGFTKIEFVVKEASRVRLTIYDILGREIADYPERVITRNGTFFVNSNDLSGSGVYVYRLQGRELSSGRSLNQSKKMLYIK